ncbi:hypothetical protein [Streptomyces sp. NPDC091268]|uniref:hypothetical protein n=1 Tax=Streptomyces sp. NPDC091268 TaxID=3365979 RepID=UPI003817F2D4
MDPASADALGYAVRALPRGRLSVVAGERTAGYPGAAARLLGGHPPVVRVPPARLTETAAALEAVGLPARWAGPVHRYCGGHRALLAAFCRALAEAAAGRDVRGRGRATALPTRPRQVRELAGAWLATVPSEVRATLLVAALARHPDADLLRRAGFPDAEDHLEQAVRMGLLVPHGAAGPEEPAAREDPAAPSGHAADAPDATEDVEAVTSEPARTRFAAAVLAEAAAATATAGERRRIHRALAGAVRDPVRRARHHALAQDGPDQAVAEDTARAAETARGAGQRSLAAELLLLAARLTPVDRPEPRLERLAAAARDAAAAGSVDLARRAATLIAEDRGSPAQRVHALLAVADAHGQDLTETEPLLATARKTAAGDPTLLAAVELRTSVQANVAAGDAARALHHAAAATELARACGDVPLEAAALTMTARMERVLGRLDRAPATLAAALALAVPPSRIGIRNSPEYLAARHAVFDGRFPEARRILTGLLPAAQSSGEAEDLVDIWRSLAEVDSGLGACARALRWADHAVDLTAAAGCHRGPPGTPPPSRTATAAPSPRPSGTPPRASARPARSGTPSTPRAACGSSARSTCTRAGWRRPRPPWRKSPNSRRGRAPRTRRSCAGRPTPSKPSPPPATGHAPTACSRPWRTASAPTPATRPCAPPSPGPGPPAATSTASTTRPWNCSRTPPTASRGSACPSRRAVRT